MLPVKYSNKTVLHKEESLRKSQKHVNMFISLSLQSASQQGATEVSNHIRQHSSAQKNHTGVRAKGTIKITTIKYKEQCEPEERHKEMLQEVREGRYYF